MKLAKPYLDVALFTNQREPMLSFWQEQVGLPFEELLPTGGGNQQHRHGMNGSVLKLNHARDPLPQAPAGGVRELWIAREGQSEVLQLTDPDGNRVALVPPGHRGVRGIGLRLAVRDPEAHARFYREALGLRADSEGAIRCGDSVLSLEADASAEANVALLGQGYRYLTIQVFDCAATHANVLARGGSEGAPPRRMGDLARFSMVRDPDGNWLEISQRASLTGALD